MNAKQIAPPCFEVTHYDGKAIVTTTVPRHEIYDIDPQSVDHYLDLPHGTLAYRMASGVWVPDGWAEIGNVTLEVLMHMQWNAGEFLTPKVIAQLTGYHSLREPNNLSARLSSLRRAHRESHKTPHFFRSRRKGGMAVAWSPARTWMWVERVSLSSAAAAEGAEKP